MFEKFFKICQKNNILLQSYKTKGYFTWRPQLITIISRWILKERNVSDQTFREIQDKHFMFNNYFFEHHAVYKTMWKIWYNKRVTEGNIIWHMCFACRIKKTTNTHPACVVLIAFPLQQWLHERASMLRYTHIACPVYMYHCHFLHFLEGSGNFATVMYCKVDSKSPNMTLKYGTRLTASLVHKSIVDSCLLSTHACLLCTIHRSTEQPY